MRERTFWTPGDADVTVTSPEGTRLDARCFSDEVGIDFPSMVPAVDRIRDAFVADERPAPFSAAIELSSREAREGIRLPVDVPVRSLCRHCGGRGESWSELCPQCDGRGFELLRHRLQVAFPAGVLDGACFRFTVRPRRHLPTSIELRVAIAGVGA
jgi:hypothetical protein